MQKALSSIEEVPYYFLGSSIKFQGHTGWKMDDLNPIWVRLLGRSQLSNPSDLPCWDIGPLTDTKSEWIWRYFGGNIAFLEMFTCWIVSLYTPNWSVMRVTPPCNIPTACKRASSDKCGTSHKQPADHNKSANAFFWNLRTQRTLQR